MRYTFLLLIVLESGILPIKSPAPPSDTVLDEPHLKDNETKPTLSFESTRLLHHYRQSEIIHQQKLSNVNGSNLQFQFTDCGNTFSIIKFVNLLVTPDPIVTPGQIKTTFKIDFKKTILDKLRADVKLTRKIGSTYFEIPCIGTRGSCIYENICNQLALIKQCPPIFSDYGFNCKCPFKKGLIAVPWVRFGITRNVAPSGQYALHVLLYHINSFAGCLKLNINFNRL